MDLTIKIEPHAKIPRKLSLFLGRYFLYKKYRSDNSIKPKNISEWTVHLIICIMGESVKFAIDTLLFLVAAIKVHFGVVVKGFEKFFD